MLGLKACATTPGGGLKTILESVTLMSKVSYVSWQFGLSPKCPGSYIMRSGYKKLN